MRVAWVHPSWRDLLIERLAADAAARRRFLRACGPTGALLALSGSGGAAGERRLPLLTADEDWDALTQRLHDLLPDLASDDLRSLLLGVAAALEVTAGYAHREARALGEQLLGWVVRRWHAHPRQLTVELLAAWLELADALPEHPEPPHLEPLLLDLAPGPDMDLARLEHCERLDDWLWVAGVAHEHRPYDLEPIGFPHRYADDLRRLLDRAAGDPRALAHSELLARVERRLRELGVPAAPLPAIGGEAPEPFWTVADPAPAGDGPRFRSTLVERVLRDL